MSRPRDMLCKTLETALRFSVRVHLHVRNKPRLVSALFVAALFFPISPAFAAGAVDGKSIFGTSCVACHGTKGEGNKQIGAPNIAGMDPTYVARQLSNFASGVRGAAPGDSYGAQMRAAVAVLKTDADRAAVVAYIASLPKMRSTTEFKGDLSYGSTQFNAVCSSCHESRAQGNQQMGAPALVGLEPAYLERQITAFRNGTRGANKDDRTGGLMKVGANMLPDTKSVHDVVAYINTLKP